MQRNDQIEQFLSKILGQNFVRHPLAADASFRRYERILSGDAHYILMDAPPPKEDVRPFMAVTAQLRSHALHAPEIYHSDETNGFLLLEDLGADSYTKHLKASPEDEWPLYQGAIDVLIHLHQAKPDVSALPIYHAQEYDRELRILTDWYLPTIGKEDQTDSFLSLWQTLLSDYPLSQDIMVLRDYHADNLMWLPKLDGLARIGLLDYQDAIAGDTAYDLVSLLEDARRDVAPETVSKALDYYISAMGIDRDEFLLRYCLLGAQRNCKIIGIFNRLNARDGKAHYLDYLPRVWDHLKRDLEHPALGELKAWISRHCH